MNHDGIPIPGCRHDILGHNLKAIGLLRALATCADSENSDPEAEAWWDLHSAYFWLRSQKYPDETKFQEFFAKHYRPTPIFSPWNKGGGLDEKQELLLKIDRKPVHEFLIEHDATLGAHGYNPDQHSWKDGRLTFELRNGEFSLQLPPQIELRFVKESGGKRPKKKVLIQWAPGVTERFGRFLRENLSRIEQAASVSKLTKAKLEQGQFSEEEIVLTIKSSAATSALTLPPWILREIRTKVSGKKATIAVVQERMSFDSDTIKAIEAGRKYFDVLQAAETADEIKVLLESYRDEISDLGSVAIDAVFTLRTAGASDNPLFLNRGRGEGGNDELFRTFWVYFLIFHKDRGAFANQSLLSRDSLGDLPKENKTGKGTPFFPDAIKTYNNGLGWFVESFPFNALDYLLAVEGALALRGTVSRTLGANSRRFAGFPFIFDSGEDLVDEGNKVTGTASSVWLPLWDRPTTFAELESFICDAQARLPGKDARFSAEFARALRAQGVDAGFAGWQEFRFKMKASRVPWICTGRYLGTAVGAKSTLLNEALAPLDESAFPDQFEPLFKGNKIDSRGPHRIRAVLNAAIEDAIAEPKTENALNVLVKVYEACQEIATSKALRESIVRRGRQVRLFDALPRPPWQSLLDGLDSPEFRIARALGSITGLEKQRTTDEPSRAQPLLGSLLPLKRGTRGWYLPTDSQDRSNQAVWSGIDLCGDLSRVLSRRYLDSLGDDCPAIRSPCPARLDDILSFLRGELDDHRIARWIEALSLIGWHWEKEDELVDSTVLPEDKQPPSLARDDLASIPLAYAAVRTLLELECEWQGPDPSVWKKRRSQRPVALVCQRSNSSLPIAVEEALRWISIWNVPNCYGPASRREKPRLAGQDIVRIDHRELNFDHDTTCLVNRLAAAVLIPLEWRDQRKLFRAVTLPQAVSI